MQKENSRQRDEEDRRGYLFSIPAESDDGYQLVEVSEVCLGMEKPGIVIPDLGDDRDFQACHQCSSSAPDPASLVFYENEDLTCESAASVEATPAASVEATPVAPVEEHGTGARSGADMKIMAFNQSVSSLRVYF